MNNTAYIALGSNIGKKETYLKEAVKKLHEHPDVQVELISSIYETTPVGYENQDDFLNMAVKISTSLRPNELLALTQKIEQELGRTREVRWGPRTADLDILLYNRENIETEQLVIPHPRMYERLFVLVPMSEICPEIGEVQINAVTDQEGVSIWKKTCGVEEFVHTVS
ncbi:2-amino-4-hydroxy-6-hydroxymethyldihydropteridine diphosphokinase [Bacillus xiamenensis]|uniref:2-amino-4-hydroxy-6-hydroxymethyldihydropteridine diphosphokinase n=1 Tax=Bacillus xiamenensis TaxID=1178537 RepID=A0AAC9IFC6_9BACI|nr:MULTISPECIES: 2-amino-4-hydroxy-6-hydroxymethyldihydropteridine diphosphokinase [Bacillus]AOZ88590.1 2-amino-4-hydroxy-6-hydroxymethyldihydropteridine diphosphokinase [Bacillus xiamenensis]EKF35933.1 2-amino-4-hydroxy-6-hydroxymethyldihydropteridine pyrophosphokinase [Bacillus xiamenensis]MBG9910722.1 2-amino-4-hydroxy-6-hydroxymethyldihydropteridine pyrophosphokinase [Bacillus xiamenensis]MCW1838020.1 2-amino-4-hydroxy-6-hydroxymethyldihydropteridine diphosphokinase [Bacillus xiamenensis]M